MRTQEEVAFRNQAPMKLGKHRLNTCHAHIAKCFITLAGIINILDTEAVHRTLVWAGLDTKCRTDYTDHCSTAALMRTLQALDTLGTLEARHTC